MRLLRHLLRPAGPDSVYLCAHAVRSQWTLRQGAAEVAGGFRLAQPRAADRPRLSRLIPNSGTATGQTSRKHRSMTAPETRRAAPDILAPWLLLGLGLRGFVDRISPRRELTVSRRT